jgi:F-type H+-transporting ATPase subunit b
MPQLDVSTYSSQIFWLSITFSILYFTIKLKIIPLFDNLYKNRWENIDGVKKLSEQYLKEAQGIESERKKLLEDSKKRSFDILSNSDSEAKAHFSAGKTDFLNSVQKRLLETKDRLKDQEYSIEKNILEGVIPLTVDIVVKSSHDILYRDKVESYLKNNIVSIKETLDLRN